MKRVAIVTTVYKYLSHAQHMGDRLLIVFYGAYLSEIFRAALKGIHPGQKEAAEALGMSRLATFAHVTAPQALRLALPGTNTMFVDLLKSTSLLVVIGAFELMTEAQVIASETFRAFEVYVVIAGIYFLMCFPLSQGLLWLERRVQSGSALLPSRRRLLPRRLRRWTRMSPRRSREVRRSQESSIGIQGRIRADTDSTEA